MLIFLAYTTFPSLKTKQSWQKTLSRLSRCHTLSRTSHEGITNESRRDKTTCRFLPKSARKVVFLHCPTKKIEKNYFISEILSIFAE